MAKNVSCKADKQPPSPAEVAYGEGRHKEAADLFITERAAHPDDARLRAGQIRNLLLKGDVDEATKLANAWLAEKPDAGMAVAAHAETTLRSGRLPEAYAEAAHAQKLDGCNGRTYYVLSEYEDMIAMYGTEKRHLELAHALSPTDRDIQLSWIATRPKEVARKEWASYVETSPFLTDKQRELAKQRIAQQQNRHEYGCTLTSPLKETTIPFSAIRYSADAAPAYGLEMTFNGKKRRLELDTGASGLTLTSVAAERLGLVTEATAYLGGMGDEGARKSRVTHVAKLNIGGLEFADCNVYILPASNMDNAIAGLPPFMDDIDGLVGGDIFRKFLLTLDYPGGQMKVSPLPPRLGDQDTKIALETDGGEGSHSLNGTNDVLLDRYRGLEMQDWTQFYRIYHYLLIPTQLNDGPVKLLMADTGATESIIAPDAARSVTKVSTTNRYAIGGISGQTRNTYITDKIVLHFANLFLPLQGMLSTETTGLSRDAGVEISGFLGFTALKQMTLEIDYRDGLIHFVYDPKRKPDSRFASSTLNN